MSRPLLYVCLAGSLLFVAAGAAMMVSGAKAGVPVTLFFGVCAVIFVWQLWPETLQREARSIESLLSRYPGPVVIKAAATRLLVFATGSAIFGGVSLWMLLNEPLSTVMQVLLWPGVVLFLGGAPLLLVMAVKGASIHLSRDGFEVVQAWSRKSTRWHGTSEFTPVIVSGTLTKLVVFDDAAAESSRVAGINRKLTNRNSGLPDTYGLTHEELAALLNAWRARALQDGVVAKR